MDKKNKDINIKSAFFVQMDDSILRLNIPMGQKVILGAIVGLSRGIGYCYASDEQLAKLLYSTSSSVKNTISRLYKSTLLSNIGNRNDRKLVFNGNNKNKQTYTAQNETDKSYKAQNEITQSQNETYTYIIYKYNINYGQIKIDLLTLKEFYDLMFSSFWTQYPKKVKKLEAKQIFTKLKIIEIDNLFEVLPNIISYHAQETEEFIPDISHPTTFLRGKRWEDEIYKPKKQTIPTKNEEIIDDELKLSLKRFYLLSDGNDIELTNKDKEILKSLNITQEEAIDIAIIDGFNILKEKIIKVW